MAASNLLIYPAVIVICVALVSCEKDYEGKYVAHAASSDGAWIAAVRTDQNFGPETASLTSTVELQPHGDANKATEVLMVDLGEAAPPHRPIAVRWASPSRLAITVSEGKIDYQVVRARGIDIITTEAK